MKNSILSLLSPVVFVAAFVLFTVRLINGDGISWSMIFVMITQLLIMTDSDN